MGLAPETYINASAGTGASPAAIATSHASMAALIAAAAALSGGGAGVVDIRTAQTGNPKRVDVYPSLAGGDGVTGRVDVYLAFKAEANSEKLNLDYAGQIAATSGTDAVTQPSGGPASHYWAKSTSWTTSGLLEARTGAAAAVFGGGGGSTVTGSRAGLAIPDTGEADALVLVPAKGAASAATSVSATVRVWN